MLLATLGSIMILVGAIWLIVIAVQTGADTKEKVIWALANFFCQPIGGIVFYIMRKQGLVPMLIVVAGTVLYLIGGGTAMLSSMGR